MAERSVESLEWQKKYMAEQLWLDYFNQTLYEKGLITESERNRMSNKIASRNRPPIRGSRER